jgi:hypothetical protein
MMIHLLSWQQQLDSSSSNRGHQLQQMIYPLMHRQQQEHVIAWKPTVAVQLASEQLSV